MRKVTNPAPARDAKSKATNGQAAVRIEIGFA